MQKAAGVTTIDVPGQRIAAVDALRGVAIAAMVVYHFSWDLSFLGFISVNIIADPGWIAFARTIAATFIGLVGVSLVLATRQGLLVRPFLWRLAKIVAAAALVTAGTYYWFPDAFVFFGILHLIAFASVAALPFLWLPTPIVLLVGMGALALPFFFRAAIFANPLLWWVGLSPVPPTSVDYVPVFPWFAMTLFGIVAGRLVVDHAGDSTLATWTPSGFLGRAAIFAGRWSLFIYLIHQPILIGILGAIQPFAVTPDGTGQFVAQCTTQCRVGGIDQPTCEATCQCVLARMDRAGLSISLNINQMSAAERDQWISLVRQCLPSASDPPVDSRVN